MISSTFGAPFGGTTRGGQYGFESFASSLITPSNFVGGGGSCLPSTDMVAEGDPGVPVICWAEAVPAHRNMLAIAAIHPEVACNFMDLLPLMTRSVLSIGTESPSVGIVGICRTTRYRSLCSPMWRGTVGRFRHCVSDETYVSAIVPKISVAGQASHRNSTKINFALDHEKLYFGNMSCTCARICQFGPKSGQTLLTNTPYTHGSPFARCRTTAVGPAPQ